MVVGGGAKGRQRCKPPIPAFLKTSPIRIDPPESAGSWQVRLIGACWKCEAQNNYSTGWRAAGPRRIPALEESAYVRRRPAALEGEAGGDDRRREVCRHLSFFVPNSRTVALARYFPAMHFTHVPLSEGHNQLFLHLTKEHIPVIVTLSMERWRTCGEH